MDLRRVAAFGRGFAVRAFRRRADPEPMCRDAYEAGLKFGSWLFRYSHRYD